jgi:DNA-binding response OmpR family regulator
MPPADSSVEGDRPRVLVVDDDASVRRSVRWILEDEGLAVESAGDGREALSSARRRRPSLVLLDMSLPTASGEQVAAGLHALYGSGVPIIVITALGQIEARSRRVGALDYLLRPFEVEALLAAVRRALAPR